MNYTFFTSAVISGTKRNATCYLVHQVLLEETRTWRLSPPTAGIDQSLRQNNALDLDESVTYQDLGVSAWKGKNRTEGMLKAILDAIKSGRIKAGTVLLVERLDRLSREGVMVGISLMMDILRAGLNVHSTATGRVFTKPTDSTTEFMLSMEMGMEFFQAALENEKRSERVGKAWKSKKANAIDGKSMTAMCPFWLKAERGQPIVEIPGRVHVVQKIFTLAQQGLGARRIINRLDAEGVKPFSRKNDGRRGQRWTLSYVHKLLRNRCVLGEMQPYNWVNGVRSKAGEVIEGYYPRIIDQSQFDAVQTVINSKNKEGHHSGGRVSLEVRNLFTGLCYNLKSGLAMVYRSKSERSPANLVSAWRQGVSQNRIRYGLFEKTFLTFIKDLDWKSVAGTSESEECKAAAKRLDEVLPRLDKVNRLITDKTAAMDGDLDVPALRELASQIAKHRADALELTSEKGAIQGKLEAARAKCEALYNQEELLELINSGAASNDLRLRLQNEIRKRILRIDLDFTDGGLLTYIRFVNGADRLLDYRKDEPRLAHQVSWERPALQSTKVQ